jgi:phosphohistidine swiveling domain-containing protein
VLTLRVAMPPESGAVPKLVEPLKKATVPVGVPAEELTVAVSVTAVPAVAGLALEVNVIVGVVLPAALTCSVSGELVTVRKLVSPE